MGSRDRLREIRRECLSGVRFFRLGDLLRRALGHNTASFFAALGPQIDNPVRIADHVQVVFDDDDGIAQVGQPVKHI